MSNDYAALAGKYGDFTLPVMKIFSGGSEVISGQEFEVENLSLSLSLNEAGSVQFNVANVFHLSSRTFSSAAKKCFSPGSVIKVELGYGSATRLMFKGYVSELCLDFGEMPQISVTALDVTRLLMESVHRNHTYEVTSYSAAFQEVMKEFSGLYDSLEVDRTDDVLTKIIQNDTDYRFIREELCAKANREFMVLGGKVYFRTPASEKESVAELNWGEGLMSFQERKSQCNQVIRVYGKAENRKDQLMKEVTVRTQDSSSDIVVVKEYQNYSLVGEDAVSRYAGKLSDGQKAAGRGGSGTCIGLPELVPGSYISLGNLDSDTRKKYYIRRVTHNMGSEGYTTQFEAEGCQ